MRNQLHGMIRSADECNKTVAMERIPNKTRSISGIRIGMCWRQRPPQDQQDGVFAGANIVMYARLPMSSVRKGE